MNSLVLRCLKVLKKNLNQNYEQIINLKRKDQLKTKEDVSVAEAFELYMLKHFHKVKLNSLTSKMLEFWEKDFDLSVKDHLHFLKENLEDQNVYSSKFSEILQNMDIFDTEENEEQKEENNDEGQDNPSMKMRKLSPKIKKNKVRMKRLKPV